MITVIGLIKNAADVIETYIRANSLIADNFVLINNFSTDRTIEILNALQNEGFNIEIIDDTKMEYLQGMKMTKLAQYAAKKYKSDYIIPLDDDEIIYSDVADAKDIIYQLDSDSVHYVHWKVYIPTEEDNLNEICVARRQTYCFVDSIETERKIIIPGKICLQDDLKIYGGNHVADASIVKHHCTVDILRIAHFPCRSQEQLIAKSLIGKTGYLLINGNVDSNMGKQWTMIYEKLKNGQEITAADQWLFCTYYLKNFSIDDFEVEISPLIIDESAFTIKYTSANEVNSLRNYILLTEEIIAKYKEK